MENHNDDHCEEEKANFSVGLFFVAVLAALFVIGLPALNGCLRDRCQAFVILDALYR